MKSRFFLALFVFCASFSASTAFGEPSQYRKELTERSLREALGERAVPLLKFKPPAGGREAALQRLLSVLKASRDRHISVREMGPRHESKRRLKIRAADGSWSLRVDADGSRVRYRGHLGDRTELPSARPLDLAALERLGRAYIAGPLAPLVPLSASDRLVFLGTRYLRSGSASESDPRFTSAPIAGIALFGREVRGTFVAGPGSKVSVWFTNKGEPIAFDVDWPEYQVEGTAPATLSRERARDRLYKQLPDQRENIERNTKRFECGYIDGGAYHRSAIIQAGCLIHHDGLVATGRYARVDAVPLALDPTPDRAWSRETSSAEPARAPD